MCKTAYAVLNSVMEKIKPKETKKSDGEHAEIAEMGNPQPKEKPVEGEPGLPK